MTIRITPNFKLRRVAGQLVASIGTAAVTLTASQARTAAEAFNVMAVMVESAEEVECPIQTTS